MSWRRSGATRVGPEDLGSPRWILEEVGAPRWVLEDLEKTEGHQDRC